MAIIIIFLLSNKETLLPHPSRPLAFLSLEKQVENNVSRSLGKHFRVICPCVWLCQLWVLWGSQGSPGPLRYLGWFWLEFMYLTMCMKHLPQVGPTRGTQHNSVNEADTISGLQFYSMNQSVTIGNFFSYRTLSTTSERIKVFLSPEGLPAYNENGHSLRYEIKSCVLLGLEGRCGLLRAHCLWHGGPGTNKILWIPKGSLSSAGFSRKNIEQREWWMGSLAS